MNHGQAPPQTHEQTQPQTLALSDAHTLQIDRARGGDLIRIAGADGLVALTVHVSPRGLEVRLEGAALTLKSSGALTVDAERLRLRGRLGVEIETDGALSLKAQEQAIEATLGSVQVRANDDISLDGERVRLNCDDQPRRRTHRRTQTLRGPFIAQSGG
ncbi:MAG: hypothetical protein IPK80_13285 [Nannocystis sp.]|nr:hypothetical protein [Nannocystis sp.]